MSAFARLVRLKRQEKHLSQFELALQIGVKPQTISRLEKKGSCSLKKAVLIAQALGLEAIPVK